MNIDLIPVGEDPPNSLNVIIEVPVGGEPVKYEFDKASGALFVDRILHTPMRYPANYGFVPHTLSPDGDPLDALVIARSPFVPGSVVRARPIAVLNLEDEAGGDEKLVCVPDNKTFPYYTHVGEMDDLPTITATLDAAITPDAAPHLGRTDVVLQGAILVGSAGATTSCEVRINVQSAAQGAYANTIAPGNVTADGSISNTAPADGSDTAIPCRAATASLASRWWGHMRAT